MSDDLDTQIAYWDAAATTKTFTHPLHLPWLEDLDRNAAVLDYGCGYGRALTALQEQGFADLTGVDTSPEMIAEARRRQPGAFFAVLDAPPALQAPDDSFDLVLLLAVLTCIPGDDAQHGLIREVARVLRPGGLLYVSDLLLQEDARSRERYERFAGPYGTYGVFETSDGAVCRHHPADHLTSLLDGFTVTGTRRPTVATMNGRTSAAGIQLLARKD
ncbi:class I SAM-dependent methyltransferase [Streptomyces sp. NBC_01465]|uniref:class I SAM-dependent methyltransferase n=1 Tax=Streptomyces sp. NBC_01465 TaxID=2903878 RepID=UPI002E318128|nr:class I SAM-dependent methyltransferase [Streptomyces sp. NBC_01465]